LVDADGRIVLVHLVRDMTENRLGDHAAGRETSEVVRGAAQPMRREPLGPAEEREDIGARFLQNRIRMSSTAGRRQHPDLLEATMLAGNEIFAVFFENIRKLLDQGNTMHALPRRRTRTLLPFVDAILPAPTPE